MTDEKKSENNGRRNFMKGVALGGAAFCAAALTPGTQSIKAIVDPYLFTF